jgi:N-acetylglucosamine-6-phosphate deacetylase
MKAFFNGSILSDEHWLENHAVLVEDGKITSICDKMQIPEQAELIDLTGNYLIPGFIDCQVNGGGGILLNDQPDIEAFAIVAAAHRKFGTAAFLPTLISDSWDKMSVMAEAMERAIEIQQPGIVGVHFEGPYLNPARKGVHDPDYIRMFEDRFLNLINDKNLGAIVVTLAPEIVETDLIKRLTQMGVRVCAGHTNASYVQTKSALDAGLAGFTHLYNAMPPFLSREPGVIGAALEDKTSFCGIIVDGYHVHPATLKAAIAAKSPDQVMLVTDSMPCVGTEAQSFQLGNKTVKVQNGRCETEDGTLAGSALDMASAVRNAVNLLDLPLIEALKMATTTPARFLGLDERKGQIKTGYDADLVLLAPDLNVMGTWIGGMEEHDLLITS